MGAEELVRSSLRDLGVDPDDFTSADTDDLIAAGNELVDFCCTDVEPREFAAARDYLRRVQLELTRRLRERE